MAEELADVVERLYALPPEEFTAARDAAAEEASGDLRKQVKALRRPTASAALVNQLRRAHPDLLDELLDLGPALAQAQAARSGDELRALGQQRRELVQAVVGTAAPGAGAPVRTEVEQTLEAALADPAAADAVRSGALVRPLSFAGFGGVDVEGAVAAPPRPVRRPAKAGKGIAAAEQAAQDAAAALDDAVGAAEAARRRAQGSAQAQERAEEQRRQAAAEVEDAERRLSEARERLSEAGHRAHDAQTEAARAGAAAERALQRVAEAQDAAEQARAELDRLRRR